MQLLRDNLFLLAHDEDDGFKPRTSIPFLGVALVGATLADLLRLGWVHLTQTGVHPIVNSERRYSDDVIMDSMLFDLRNPSEHADTRALLALFSRYGGTIYHDTADLLTQSDVLIKHHRRLRPDRYSLYPNSTATCLSRAPAFNAVNYPLRADMETAALCALVGAAGLGGALNLALPARELDEQLRVFGRLLGEYHRREDIAYVVEAVRATVNPYALSVH